MTDRSTAGTSSAACSSGQAEALDPTAAFTSAIDIADAVRNARCTAQTVTQAALARIDQDDPRYNSFTLVTESRALAEARAVDLAVASPSISADAARSGLGGALAGVPVAVKNLFDLQGHATLAGARIRESDPVATRDAFLVSRLASQGAVIVGALNMDEHAYGFTTENTHYGATRNPMDPARIAGGSSGGSAAAVAAGLVPLSLGSDTNGSIRVPASFCGVFGLKPTFGRLSRSGTFPFVASLDHLGPFARNATDLALAYDALQGPDPDDAGSAGRPLETALPGLDGWEPGRLRVGILSGYFEEWAGPAARAAVAAAAKVFGAVDLVSLPDVDKARAAAFVMTAAEGGALHHRRLQDDYDGYEPLSRDRLVAGALIPAQWVVQAQRVRHRFYRAVREVFSQYDLLLAPATPIPAPTIGSEWMTLDHKPGERFPMRASVGLLAQPLSCIGLPVVVAPVWPGADNGKSADAHLPVGVQLIAPHWREDRCLAAARYLEKAGLAYAKRPPATE